MGSQDGRAEALTGALQVMKMAVRYKRKALTFISSVGVALPLGKPGPIMEDTLGTNIAEEFPGSGGYAFGCGNLLAGPDIGYLLMEVM